MKALKKKIMAILMSVLTVITGLYTPALAQAAPAEPTVGTLTKGDQLIYMGWGTNYFTVDYNNDDNTYSRNAFCIVPELSAPSDGDYSLAAADANMTKLLYYSAGAPGEAYGELNPTAQGGEEDAFVNSHLMLSCYYCENVINDPNWTRGLTDEAVSNFEELVTRMLTLPAPPEQFKAYIINGGSNQDIVSWRMEEISNGYLVIYKRSDDPETTDDDDTYSLSGAVFRVYKYDEAATKHQGEYVGELRTNSEGTYADGSKYSKTDVIELEAGDYTIEEVTAPRGFDINTDIIGERITVSGDTTSASVPLVYTVTDGGGEAWVYIQKVSEDPDMTEDSAAYSLRGATYQIFKYDAGNSQGHYVGALAATATTDATGKTEKVKLSAPADGSSVKYVIHESSASEAGFGVDDEWYVVELDSSYTEDSPYCLTSTEPFLSAPALKFIKSDEKNNKHLSLAGAQFTVNYFDVDPDEVDEDLGESDATWIVETVETTDDEGKPIGYAELSSDYLVDGSDPLFLTADGKATIPFGKITIEETKAPEGYIRTPTRVTSSNGIDIRDEEILSKPIVFTVSDSNGDGVPDFTFEGEMTDEYKQIYETPKYGGIAVQKIDPETREAAGYSYPQGFLNFAGATFDIINDNDGTIVTEDRISCEKGEVALTITTDENGRAATSSTALPYGKYLVVETKAPTGYLVNPTPIEVEITEQGQVVEIEYEDEVIRGGFEIQKRDFDSKNDKPQGSYDFSGVTFEVISKNAPNPVLDKDGREFRNNEVIYTFTTDENGYFRSTTDALSYGDYLIREIKAPKGYWLYGKLEATLSIREEGVIVDLTDYDDTISDRVKRGDLTFEKKDDDNVPMPHVAFMISKLSAKDGTVLESHRAYTDGNGKLMTGNRDTVKHSTNTNANDNVANIEDGSWSNGIWFGDAPVDDTMGALPDGIYLIQEERCKGNEGYSLVSFIVTINADMVSHLDYAPTPDTNNNFIVENGTIHDTKDNRSDYVIRSLAYNTDLTDKAADLPCRSMVGESGQNITDEVTWEFDNPKIEDFVLVSVIMDKETGKVFTDADGKTFKEVTRFNSEGHSHGELTVYFRGINLTGMEGKHLVIFEYLYDAKVYDEEDAPTTIADDASLTNEKQTLYVSSIRTTARTDVTGDNVGAAVKDLVITDTVSYTNLIPGYEYVLRGTLMDKETGKEFLSDGKTVTAEKRFNPTTPDGTIEMDFYVDASGLSGKSIVVFEDLYLKERLVSYHRSLSDEGQTIRFPKIGTTASDVTTEDNVGNALAEIVEIKDTVEFKNLVTGKEYTLIGTLIDKNTGKPIMKTTGIEKDEDKAKSAAEIVTAKTTLIPKTSDGTVDMIFKVPAKEIGNLSDLSVVVFESLYHNGAEVAMHSDIEDEGQTVHFPEIGTTASSGIEDNEHIASALEEKVTITDNVSFKNLVIGKEYTVKGTLVDKETGKELGVISEKAFTAKEKDGEVELNFEVDGKLLSGKTIVVFEDLFFNGIKVAAHADIEDEGQTVHFPEIGTTATSGIKDNEHIASSVAEKVTITDTVSYKNLVTGKEYTIKGTLINKETGEEIGVTAEKTFTAEKSDGTIELEFTVDGKVLAGKTVVAFEDLYFKAVKLAVHADIEDEDQMIHFPEAKTKASVDGKQKVTVSKETKLIDTVEFKNLVVGKEYRLVGSLMNSDGTPVLDKDGKAITKEVKFTPEKADGSIDVEFIFDSTSFAGKSVVCFETLYFGEFEIATHSDINDAGQTVTFEKPEIPKSPQTSDETTPLPTALFLAAAAALVLLLLAMKKKDIKKRR